MWRDNTAWNFWSNWPACSLVLMNVLSTWLLWTLYFPSVFPSVSVTWSHGYWFSRERKWGRGGEEWEVGRNWEAERAWEIIVSIQFVLLLFFFSFTEAGQMLCFNLLFQLLGISLSCSVWWGCLLKFNIFIWIPFSLLGSFYECCLSKGKEKVR